MAGTVNWGILRRGSGYPVDKWEEVLKIVLYLQYIKFCFHNRVLWFVLSFLQLHPTYSPTQVKATLLDWSTKGELQMDNFKEDLTAVTPNRLLYVPTKQALQKMEMGFQ